MTQEHSKVAFQVMWNRLISVVEEQAQVLVRTAFSNICSRGRRPVSGRLRHLWKHAGPSRDRYSRACERDG